MIAFIAFSTLFTLACAQWGGQHQQQGYQQPPPQQSYQQPPPQSYQPQQSYQQPPPQQPSYQPAPQQSYQPPAQQRSYQPAPVHYVNIGQELAGDYKFGYDTGKGQDGQSFREETRNPDGSVSGAYGYVDDTGKQRVIRYTAGKNGYQVEGDGIPKAPAAPAAPQQPAAPAHQGYAPNPNYNNQGRY